VYRKEGMFLNCYNTNTMRVINIPTSDFDIIKNAEDTWAALGTTETLRVVPVLSGGLDHIEIEKDTIKFYDICRTWGGATFDGSFRLVANDENNVWNEGK
jgi:hypothetical protein